MEPIPASALFNLTIRNKVSEIRKIVEVIQKLGIQWNFSSKVAMDLNLALEEIVANILFYAFDDSREHLIQISFEKRKQILTIEVTDEGKPFNLLEKESYIDVNLPLEDRKIGGLGIHLLTTIMDGIEYKRELNCNHVILTKKC